MLKQRSLEPSYVSAVEYIHMTAPFETIHSSMFMLAKIHRFKGDMVKAKAELADHFAEISLAITAAGVPTASIGVMDEDTFFLCSMPPYGFDRGIRRAGPKILGEM